MIILLRLIYKKAGTRQLSDSHRAPVFSWVQRLVCDAIERHFEGERYKSLAALFPRPESRINQGFFRPYRVTFARSFLMRSAVCLRVTYKAIAF